MMHKQFEEKLAVTTATTQKIWTIATTAAKKSPELAAAAGIAGLSTLITVARNSECSQDLASTFIATAALTTGLLIGAKKAQSHFFPKKTENKKDNSPTAEQALKSSR